MKEADYFLLLSAVLVTPHISAEVAYTIGALCVACTIFFLWKGR